MVVGVVAPIGRAVGVERGRLAFGLLAASRAPFSATAKQTCRASTAPFPAVPKQTCRLVANSNGDLHLQKKRKNKIQEYG